MQLYNLGVPLECGSNNRRGGGDRITFPPFVRVGVVSLGSELGARGRAVEVHPECAVLQLKSDRCVLAGQWTSGYKMRFADD